MGTVRQFVLTGSVREARLHEEWALNWLATSEETPSPEDSTKPHPFAVEKAVNCTADANEYWAKVVGLLLASLA